MKEYFFETKTKKNPDPKAKQLPLPTPVKVVYIGDKKPLALTKPKEVIMPLGGSPNN